MSRVLDELRLPIVQAPLSGGASTPALTLAALSCGAFGFIAAGYLTAQRLRDDIRQVKASSSEPFGVNLFVPGTTVVDAVAVRSFTDRVRTEAAAVGAEPGEAKWSDDEWDAKLDVIRSEGPAVASFTFGCPEPDLVSDLKSLGIEVWVTVTEPREARVAAESGADALVLQGVEAGGHRAAFFDEDGSGELGLIPLIRLVSKRVNLPVVASGGIADGNAIAAVLLAGARAAQVGSAFLDTNEAGTSAPHREALRANTRTALTRAFTGRRARGIVNGFMQRNSAAAPSAYPQVHYLTAPMRSAARAANNPDLVNLWAGQSYELIDHQVSAAEVVARLARELAEALGYAEVDAGGRVWIFFYGSYMNFDVLKDADVVPSSWEVARAPGFDLQIGHRANLVRSENTVVWGVNVLASHDEISRLYTGRAQAVLGETYLPEAIVTVTTAGKLRPAIAYVSPGMAARPADGAYVGRIVDAARRLGFPESYVARIERFRA